MNQTPAAATAVAVTEPSEVGQARRLAARLSESLDFPETGRGSLAIVATEAARNLIAHGGGGELLLQPVSRGGTVGIEVLALDKGPGMASVADCLRDGYSTAGTPGTGLGAIRRLADDFDLYSRPGAGTALLARLWARPIAAPPGPFALGGVRLAMAGQEDCGDAWAWHWDGVSLRLLLCDGLGHGPVAAEASQQAARCFSEHPRQSPADLLQMIHGHLRQTRGAVAAAAEVRVEAGEVEYAGVGNVAGAVITEGTARSMISHNGTLGYQAHKFSSFSYPSPGGSLIVLNSDGLNTRWNLGLYPGLPVRDPALVAGVLYRDFTRGRDDVTVIVLRLSVEP